MAIRQRRRFTGAEKTSIVKKHLVDKVAISDLCDQHQIQVAQFSNWQKQLFEQGAAAFERSAKKGKSSDLEVRIAELEATLTRRTEVLAVVLEGSLGTWAKTEHRERLAGSRGRQ